MDKVPYPDSIQIGKILYTRQEFESMDLKDVYVKLFRGEQIGIVFFKSKINGFCIYELIEPGDYWKYENMFN